ncbi:MAG: sigma-54 dependent transcriptional regulator [Tolumonas sp.]|nr:sigma-54 dependent transcriptional regulator [Tolumonas sp.]
MDVRELICLRTASVWIMPKEALAAGWLPCPASTIREAIDLYERRNPLVGIFLLDNFGRNEDTDRELESMLAKTSSTMEWIGLLTPEMASQPITRDLLAKYLYDYHTMPIDDARIMASLGHAYGMASLRSSPPFYCNMGAASGQDCMIGDSPAMRKVFRQLSKLAAVDSSVMLMGESGTGKELAARTIFQQSRRRAAPFIAVNCGAIPSNLIQSELFGHEKGSFTGACRRQIGHIEAANGGTLFLDEIGDLPLELQANLLRFLQERQITRVGGTEPIPVDLRVISATNRDLREDVKTGHFRKDLYFRLCVLDLELPPLRERRGDVELLAYHFLCNLRDSLNPSVRGFSPATLQQMRTYHWPGNVRELKNRVARALVMCEKRIITPQDLELTPDTKLPQHQTLAEVRAEAEMLAMQRALQESGNNIMAAARQLGVSRVTLYRMLDKYKLLVS